MKIIARKICLGFLLLIIGGLMTGCKSSKKSSKTDIIEVGELTVKPKKDKSLENRLAEEALTWLGTPYKYGASEKGKATDCSGLVLMVYDVVAEIKLPRNSKKQAEFCEKLKEDKIKPGDLVFFAIGKDNEISHVGIMIDDNQFVHASASKGVIVSEMTTPYYARNFKMYGRVPR